MIFTVKVSEPNKTPYSTGKRKDLQRLYVLTHASSRGLRKWSSREGMCPSLPYPLHLNIFHLCIDVITS